LEASIDLGITRSICSASASGSARPRGEHEQLPEVRAYLIGDAEQRRPEVARPGNRLGNTIAAHVPS
jgi:hypothetical protein